MTTKTINDVLKELCKFGKVIDNQNLGERECISYNLCIDEGGRLFVSCGGECILCFSSSPGFTGGTIYLVRDETESCNWELEQRKIGWPNKSPSSPRPSVVLRLVRAA